MSVSSATEMFSFDDSEILNAFVAGKSHLRAIDVCLAIGYNEDTYRNALERHVPEKYKIRCEDLEKQGCVALLSNRATKTPKRTSFFQLNQIYAVYY